MTLRLKNKPSQGLSFNGSQYIEVQNLGNLTPDRLDAFSLVCWFRTSSIDFGSLICKAENSGNFAGYFWGVGDTTAGNIWFNFEGIGGGVEIRTTSSGFNDGKWHCCVVTKASGSSDASDFTIYVDGVSQTTSTDANALTGSTLNSEPLNIGARNADLFFNGYLRDGQYYDYELTLSDVQSIYNNGRLVDILGINFSGDGPISYWPLEISSLDTVNEGSAFDGTLVNYSTNGLRASFNDRKNTYSLDFDGVNQYASMPHDASLTFTDTDPYTVVAWAAHDGTDSGYLISKMDNAPNGWGCTFESDGQMRMLQEDDLTGLSRIRYSNTGAVPTDNKIHLLVYRYNGNADVDGMTMFVDNEEVSSYITDSNDAANTFGGTNDINFAARSSGTGDLKKQKQCWVAVYSGALSDEEIESIYLAGMGAPPPKENRLLTTWFNRTDDGATVAAFPNDVTLFSSPRYSIERYQPPTTSGKLTNSYSPVALYSLDISLNDSLGGLPDLTVLQGSADYVRYESGAHGSFSSDSLVLGLTTPEASLQITGDLTIELTFYCRNLDQTSLLIRQSGPSDSEADNCLYQLEVSPEGALIYFSEYNAGTNTVYTTPTGIIEEEGLYHIVLVRNSNVLYFYVNGVLVDQSGTINTPTGGGDGTFYIGGNPPSFSFSGVLSNVKIINGALTESEVLLESNLVLGEVDKIAPFVYEPPWYSGAVEAWDADNYDGVRDLNPIAGTNIPLISSASDVTETDWNGEATLTLADNAYANAYFGVVPDGMHIHIIRTEPDSSKTVMICDGRTTNADRSFSGWDSGVPSTRLVLSAGTTAALAVDPLFNLDPDAWYIYVARAGNGVDGKYWVRKLDDLTTYTGVLNSGDGDIDGLRLWNRYAPFNSAYRACSEWKASAVFSGTYSDTEVEELIDRITSEYSALTTPKI